MLLTRSPAHFRSEILVRLATRFRNGGWSKRCARIAGTGGSGVFSCPARREIMDTFELGAAGRGTRHQDGTDRQEHERGWSCRNDRVPLNLTALRRDPPWEIANETQSMKTVLFLPFGEQSGLHEKRLA